MNLRNHLGRLSWAVAAKLLPLVFGAAILFLVMPALTLAEFGRYSLLFTAFNFVAILNRSLILQPMMRFASDPSRTKRYAGAGLQLSILLNLVLAAAILALASPAGRIFRLEPSDIRYVALLMGAFFLRDFGFFIQQIQMRTGRIFFIEAVYFLGSSLGFWYLWRSGQLQDGGQIVQVIALAALGSSLVSIPLGALGVGRVFRRDGAAWRDIVKYGILTLPTSLAAGVFFSADVLVLGAIYNPAVVGVYNGAKTVYRVASQITQAFGLLLTPYAARLSAQNAKAETRALFEKSAAYVFTGLVCVAILGLLGATPFYHIFIGGKYQESAPILRVLLLGAPFEGLYLTAGAILYGLGFAGVVSLVSAGGLAALVIIVIPAAYFWGTTGAGAAVAFAFAVCGLWMAMEASRRLGSNLGGIARRFGANLRSLLGRSHS